MLFLRGRLGRADVQISKDLDRIIIDNFTGKRFRKKQCEFRFTTSGRANDCDERIHREIADFGLRISDIKTHAGQRFPESEIRTPKSQ